MPVKGQMNKTRTAKSTKKGPKLKWWYILPVIAIVAISGYAIVRFSEASAVWWSIPAQNLQSREYVRKGNGTVLAKLPATAVSHGNRSGQVCATVTGTKGAYVFIEVKERGSNKRIVTARYIPEAGTTDVCVTPPGARQTTGGTHTTTVGVVPSSQGKVTVWATRIFQKR